MSITCLPDPVHGYWLLLVFDIVSYLLVGLDDTPLWRSVYASTNVAVVGVAIFNLLFPNAVVYQGWTTLVFTLSVVLSMGVFALVAGQYSALLTAFVAVIMLGAAIQWAEAYSVTWFDDTWGSDDMSTTTKVYVSMLVMVCIVLITVAAYFLIAGLRMLIWSFVVSIVLFFAVKTLVVTQGVVFFLPPDQFCCNTDDPEECPIAMKRLDWVYIVVATLARYALYTGWHASKRYEEEWKKIKLKMRSDPEKKKKKEMEKKLNDPLPSSSSTQTPLLTTLIQREPSNTWSQR